MNAGTIDRMQRTPHIVVVIGHAAHVQLFQHLIPLWKGRGWRVEVLARAKPLVEELLQARGLEYRVVSRPGGFLGLAGELAKWWTWLALGFVWRRPTLVLSVGGTFNALPCWLTRTPNAMLTDTEDATTGNRLAFPFSQHILTPEAYLDDLGAKQVRYPSFQELAYAHPRRFRFKPEVLQRYGLELGRYAVVRFVKHTAGHDLGQSGFGEAARVAVLESLEAAGLGVVLSSEDAVADRFRRMLRVIPSDDVLHVLAGARLYLGESPTMAMEAGACGTPSIWCSTRVGKLGYPLEMEKRFGLVRCTGSSDEALDWLAAELEGEGRDLSERRERMAQERADLSDWLDGWISAERLSLRHKSR